MEDTKNNSESALQDYGTGHQISGADKLHHSEDLLIGDLLRQRQQIRTTVGQFGSIEFVQGADNSKLLNSPIGPIAYLSK